MKCLLLSAVFIVTVSSCAQPEKPKQSHPAAPTALTVHAGSIPLADETNYTSAIGNDSTVVFYGREDTFVQAYKGMLQDMADFLKKNNFRWGKETHYFNRVYFSANGTIDYYFYNFRGGIATEKEKQFDTLIKEFVKTYQLPVTAGKKFVQCSPVSIND